MQATQSYTFAQLNEVRTLSTNSASPGRNIDGLLYTLALSEDACPEAVQFVPANATTAANLPVDRTIYWIALAPWINQDCTISYLATISSTQTQAFIFYLLDNGTSIPPVASDPAWSLGDGGRWKTTSNFPVYAVSSLLGQELMRQSARYSGNLTDAPNGAALALQWPSTDYVRLAAEIGIGKSCAEIQSLTRH